MISIDTVYQKVLALANKEQRGYITPQEYNLFANHAQMEILEQYFYDLNQFKRRPGDSGEYADIITILQDKISQFEWYAVGTPNITVANQYGDVSLENNIPNLYRLGEVSVSWPHLGLNQVVCEQLTPKEFTLRSKSKLSKHTYTRPVFIKWKRTDGTQQMKIYPYPTLADGTPWVTGTTAAQTGVHADYTRLPAAPNWSYVVINNKPLYTPTGSVHFELHPSEETELVYRILGLAGIAIEKPQLTQVATGLQGAAIQQEKQ